MFLETCLFLLENDEDKALFMRFHAKYEKKLYAVALKILGSKALAEEAVQEAMVKVVLHFDTFCRLYEEKREEIGPWSVTIVKHEALSILRKEGRSGALAEDWDPPARESTEGESAYHRLVELIRSMPEIYREALELRFVLEWSNKETARALGLTEAAASYRVSQGRKLLMQRLEEEGYELERN